MRIELRSYDHPDVVSMVDAVQAEYTVIYGGGDEAEIGEENFAEDAGRFYVGYLGVEPVAMGGWRRIGIHPGLPTPRCAEIKRMYVAVAHRGRGLSRQMLGHLEADAAAAGISHIVLETGEKQPIAVALYESCGYSPLTDGSGWSHYWGVEGAVHLIKML